jgi:elongation factor Ts
MGIDAKLVAELRGRTGLPMMKCKQALTEADGNLELAHENLRKAGVKAAEKVAHRELKEGIVFLHAVDGAACAVSLLCLTDFVAKSADVVAFGEALVRDLFERAPADTGTGESLQDYALLDGTKVAETYKEFALKLGENIQIGSFARFKPEQGRVATYVHHNGKIAVLVELAGEGLSGSAAVETLGKDLGMHVAFHSEVQALSRDEIDPEWIEKEKEIFAAQVEKMPENKREQILMGKLNKRIQEVVLLDQPFIRNDKETVSKHVAAVAKEVGTSVEIRRFARIAAGV